MTIPPIFNILIIIIVIAGVIIITYFTVTTWTNSSENSVANVSVIEEDSIVPESAPVPAPVPAPAPASNPAPVPAPASNPVPVVSSGANLTNQLLTNPDFLDNTTGWTSSRGTSNIGFLPYSTTNGNAPAVTPSINANGGIVGSNGYLVFSYASATVSQTVSVDTTTMEKLTATLSIVNILNAINVDPLTKIDTFSFEVLFKNAANNTLYSKRTPSNGVQNAPSVFTDYSLELNRSDSTNFDDITSVTVKITSTDTGYWGGQHGACVDYCTLNYE
jgi:hypothetical protein